MKLFYFLLVLLNAGASFAEIITYEFQAEVHDINNHTGTTLGDAFSVNDLVTGYFSFDSEHPGVQSSSDFKYYLQGSESSFFADIGGVTFETGSFYRTAVRLNNPNPSYYGLDVLTFNPTSTGLALDAGARISSMYMQVYDSTGTALSGLDFPEDIEFSDFDNVEFKLQVANASNQVDSELFATVTSMTRVNAVPEPTSMGMMLFGGLLLCGYKRRLSRS